MKQRATQKTDVYHRLSESIFLLDGMGALLSATLLLLLSYQVVYFGMPRAICWVLAGLALLFACYSLACHKLLKKGNQREN